MKFVLDVCVSSRALEEFLVQGGHDVVSMWNVDPSASDESVLSFALQEGRVLITEDKDFGELVFVRQLPHGPIVRTVELAVAEQVRAIGELLQDYEADLNGAVIVTLTQGHVRIRRGD